ncbi:cryptococcal mannosyltransferase 1-domain-containing protein [Lasiosphaeria ovina]|uniref:Cryptococcal mannosyltransferase 1-domain-containing protein n=1 Tax=Lasiosphaeria ovina TaxID=92902 RepID=A0AAE0NMT6_9PEZI|nr:cryptococcal mannosyltransferase 1-domain-containing protein [Lasiosphaeria ovina]
MAPQLPFNKKDETRSPPHPITLVATWTISRLRTLRRSGYVQLAIKYVAIIVVAVLALTPIFMPSYTRPPPHYRELERRCQDPGRREVGCANPLNEQVFISIILYDRGGKLSGGKWGQRLIRLIDLLGPPNVFLSIYENDSGPEGRAALADLKQRVPCRHSIVSEEHISVEQFHNITFPDGGQRTKRVAFLSELRNRALRPLDAFREERGAVEYDKVLFLNDIAFEPIDAAHLLFNTNQGRNGRADYVGACGVDWFAPSNIYDIYALRDAEGYAYYQNTYPFFGRRGQGPSRAAVLAQSDAVPVKSCWGGMMAVQARYVQNLLREPPSPAFSAVNGHVIDPDMPRNVTAPVRFRYEPGMYYDACECCLFSADLGQLARSEGHRTGIVMNPYVRVAYTEKVLRWLPLVKYWERLWVFVWEFRSLITSRADNPYRTVAEGEPFVEEIFDGGWQLVKRVGRSGLFCGVRDMQVLRKDGEHHKGTGRLPHLNWVNTRMPPGQQLSFKSWWGRILPTNWPREYTSSTQEVRETFFEWE